MRVFIPTRRRHVQRTAYALLAAKVKPVFVCDEEDFHVLRPLWPKADFLVTEVTGIHKVRQFIKDNAGGKPFLMADDDLSFKTAYDEDGKRKFKDASPADLRDCLANMLELVSGRKGGLAIGLGSAYMNVFGSPPFSLNCALAYLVCVPGKTEARYDHAPLGEDTAFCVDFGLRGGTTMRINSLIAVPDTKPNAGGINSTTGNRSRLMKESIKTLTERFPKYVRRFQSKSPSYIAQNGTSEAMRFYVANACKAGAAL